MCYLFLLSIPFYNKEFNSDLVITLSEFIFIIFGLIASYLINGDKSFMQRYIAINLSNMIILLIPLIFTYIILGIYGINEKYDRIVSIIFGTIYSGLILFNFYIIKKLEKLSC